MWKNQVEMNQSPSSVMPFININSDVAQHQSTMCYPSIEQLPVDTPHSQFEAASAAVARLTLRQNHSSAPNNFEVIQQMLKGCSLNVSPPRSTFGLSDPLTMGHQVVQGSYDHENLINLLRTDRLEKSKMLPPDYICHLCWGKGHFIKDCLLAKQKSSGTTPYQGTKRCFGQYKCEKCQRTWMSGNSWANMAQKCIKCNIKVYPHKQRPLEGPISIQQGKIQHLQQFCGKCQQSCFCCR